MNILLSAYACEPNKGSEPGVGWGWAIELAKHHQVWVLTKGNNESAITKYIEENRDYKMVNLNFVYVDLPSKYTFWKKGRRGMRLFYALWQYKASNVAMKLHEKIKFDLVQHVTFVSYTQPTYLYKLGIPIVWGPVSGGENIPKQIKIEMTLKENMIEITRKLSQKIAIFMPSIRKTMRVSSYIIAATEETKRMIPERYQYKTIIMPAIGLEKLPKLKPYEKVDDKIRIIMAGRLIYWKAFDIGLKAYLKIADKYPNTELHILGEGKKKEKLMEQAGYYLGKQIFFKNPVSHDQIYDFYRKYDIFLNTSLRDSGCMTMMEAIAVGVPCLAIATGGPKILLEGIEECQIQPLDYQTSINRTSEAIIRVLDNEELNEIISSRNLVYTRNKLMLSQKVSKLNVLYEEIRQNMMEKKK